MTEAGECWECKHLTRCADSVCSYNPAAQRWIKGERDPKEVRRLASEARHEALRLLREQFPLTYRELHRAALEARGLGRSKGE